MRARYASDYERDFDLAVICDGLGGMQHGAEASTLALSAFVSTVARHSRVPAEERMFYGISEANHEVHKAFRGGGGTTLSAVLIRRMEPPIICHVGDSRIYELAAQAVRQITHDDTLEAALKKQPEPGRVRRDTRLLQFVGMGADLEAQLFAATRHRLDPAPRYLLTSDGAHDVPQDCLERVTKAAKNNADLSQKLVQLSDILGGLDNSTAIALPAYLSRDSERPSEGLDLHLLAPTGQLRIWIPQLADEKRGQVAYEAPREFLAPTVSRTQVDAGSGSEDQSKASSIRSNQAKPRRLKLKSSKKKKKAETDELPLTIQFPKSQGR